MSTFIFAWCWHIFYVIATIFFYFLYWHMFFMSVQEISQKVCFSYHWHKKFMSATVSIHFCLVLTYSFYVTATVFFDFLVLTYVFNVSAAIFSKSLFFRTTDINILCQRHHRVTVLAPVWLNSQKTKKFCLEAEAKHFLNCKQYFS